jgi:Mrp family chromosome partitioning ATPase
LIAASGGTAVQDLKEARRMLAKSNVIGTVLNKAPGSMSNNNYYYY